MRSTNQRTRVETTLKREAPALLAYFQRRVRPVEDAGDLLSETMIVAWRRADVVPADERQARMWLFGVARNTLSTHRRGQARRDALSSELRSQLSTRPDLAGRHWRHEEDPRVDLVRELVAALPEIDREIFALVVWDGFSLTEVADMLDVPAGTVRSRYSRARANVRARLEKA
ncbi:RNA polymerase sigma factor [uncultured Amnibacterium sp.]|uniref:RNA polymerase sigma factor n=1 Tax=uncultured Amnibacterium sp. TaxID=1631851 RepID=UPI0035CAD2C0